MVNPFIEDQLDMAAERELVARAQGGDASALERLIRLHQPWLFNIALRMEPDYHEAEDLCQEIILKCFLNLASFRGESRFRTWLYRIALNQAINARQSDCERRLRASAPSSADDNAMRDYLGQEFADPKAIPLDLRLLAQETRIKCMLAMLVCLGRRQRMIFILGDILCVGGPAAAELLGMGEPAFRQALARARRRLYNFLFDRCSLVNPGKPCTCERSVAGNVNCGFIDPLHAVFKAGDSATVRDIVASARERLDGIEFGRCQELYREHPFQESPDFARKVLEILGSADFQALLDAEPTG